MTAKRKKAIELWRSGLSASAIAERVGCTANSARKWARLAGLTQPGDPPRTRYDGEGGGMCLQGSSRVSPRISGC